MRTHYPSSFWRRAVVCAMVAALACTLPAQTDPEDRTGPPVANLEQLKQRLKLTPEQLVRVRPVLEQQAQQMRDVLRDFDRNSATMRDRRKVARQVKSIRDNADKQLRGILTPAQMDELRRIREERKDQMRERVRERA